MVQIVTKDNLDDSFSFDNTNKKIGVKVDDSTIGKNTNGELTLKTSSVEFINAVKSAESITSLSTEIDSSTGHRYLRYFNESGVRQSINLSEFLSEVQVNGGSLNGQILTLTSGDQNIVIDLSIFLTADELNDVLSSFMNEVVSDAFGVHLFKVRSL